MKKYIICSMIVNCLITTSCGVYYPHLTSTPLIKEKGDTRIEGGVGLFSPSIQASFSQGATEKIAYQLAASIDPEGPGDDLGLYAQGLIGLYKNRQDRNVMELYGGFAWGRGYASRGDYPGSIYGNYQIYFVQFNYGSIKRKVANSEYGLGLKTGLLHSNMTDAGFFYDRFNESPSSYVLNMNGLIVEPTVFLRFGGKKLKFYTASGISYYLRFNHTDKRLPTWANFGLGLSYSFGGSKNKQKESN